MGLSDLKTPPLPGDPPPGDDASRRGDGFATTERPGDRIGPYKLIERIGEGGFGTVWLAERREPIVQRVALKVIKPGMDTRAVVARFEQERQALAVMDHPFIAKVFDAGATPAGRPYFVMEHVAGEPITDYADRHNLSVRQRLELFAAVCEAVQHAHLKGIIHRDIKPSNILVSVRDGKPLPKVIDFGVAKAITHTLTEKTIFTESGQLIGTPEYMSPEQAEMGATDIDTRTDVYSLGVVLYELLSGLLPFDSKALRSAGFAAICKVLREQDPPKPSTRLSTADAASGADIAKRRQTDRHDLALELRRELDWIPLKALRKDRTERYQSPSDLAREVRNYLEGKPLEAGPEATSYRVKKYIRRNKGPVAAAAAVVFALVLGLAGTGWGVREARQEATAARKAAESELAARKTADAKTAEAAAAAKKIEYNAYVANVEMASAWLDQKRLDRVRQRLDACPEPLRGWEWGWLNATADTSLAELTGHRGWVNAAAFSPDGTRIVTASMDGTARVWDATTGVSLAELTGHTESVTSAAFSPDGTRIVTASSDTTARVWDAATGAILAELKGHTGWVNAAAFSPDGTRIVTAAGGSWGGVDNTARVWDAATGASLAEFKGHKGGVRSAAFSPDGTRIVTASYDKTARVWDAKTGASLAELKGHTNDLNSATFSPDGTRIVTASEDRTARVWDAATGASLAELKGHTEWVRSAAFSPDGARIVTASSDTTARVWDAATGAILAELKGHTGWVNAAAFSPDGTRIVTAAGGNWGGVDNTARVWDAATGAILAELKGHTNWVSSAAFSPDGTRIVTASLDGTARVWDAATGASLAELKGHTEWVNSAAFSPDGTRIVTASGDGTARVWDATTGASIAELKGHKGGVRSAAFSPDGTRIVTASRDQTARVWDAKTGASLAELKGHTFWVTSAAYSPDSTRIVTASWDKTARVWDAKTGASLAEIKGHTDRVLSAAFSPDGTRIVTASVDGTARVWDAATGASLAELKGHTEWVNSAAFSPDGTRIVTASDDNTARVWDITTGVRLLELKGHTGTVDSAAFNPDGTRIVTASGDGTARVWDAKTAASIVDLKGHSLEVCFAVFSSDGTRIVTASRDGTARVWDSVPYRERLPAVQRARAAKAKMGPIVAARLAAGQSPEDLRLSFAADDVTLTAEERTAAQAVLFPLIQEQRRAAASRGAAVRRALAGALNTGAWNAVRFAPVTEEVATKAVDNARRAMELAPDDPDILNTFGVAQYRAGKFDEAIATLARSDAMSVRAGRGQQPSDWAFIAMARWKLGQQEQAREALKMFQALAAADQWKDDAEVLAWKKELDELIPELP